MEKFVKLPLKNGRIPCAKNSSLRCSLTDASQSGALMTDKSKITLSRIGSPFQKGRANKKFVLLGALYMLPLGNAK